MVFSVHPRQEAVLKKVVHSMRYAPRNRAVSLIIIQGPTGCGKSHLLNWATTKIFSPRVTRIIGNDDLITLFRAKQSNKAIVQHLYAVQFTKPGYVFLSLDEWVNECRPEEMTRLISLIQYLQAKPRVPIATAIFITCTDTFNGHAKKLWPFLAPPSRFTKRKKTEDARNSDADAVPKYVTNVRLYKPPTWMLEKYIKFRGVRNPARIASLLTTCAGDLRQLDLCIREPLAYATVSAGEASIQSEVSIFDLVQTVYAGGTRLSDSTGSLDSSDSDDEAQRTKDCVAESLARLRGVTKTSIDDILEFVWGHRDRPSDQCTSASMGYEDPEREHDLLLYHANLADDLSMIDTLYPIDGTRPFTQRECAEHTIRATAVHVCHLALEEYELDDSVKLSKPRNTGKALFVKRRLYREAREHVMRACFWVAGDESVANVISRANPQSYLDFLGATLTSADRNYGDLSDRLQNVTSEDIHRVFPKTLRSGTKQFTQTRSQKLMVPF